MSEFSVICGRASAGRKSAETLYLDADPAAKPADRINLQIEDISKRLARNVPDVLVDLLEIAAYVFCADQFASRGSSLMADMGGKWRRRFKFQIPVRRPDVWRQPTVNGTLRQTLGFLSEDEFEFDFLQERKALPLQTYLGFSNDEAAISPDEIILFSGGLDSLAGTVDAVVQNRKSVVLVSHQASTLISSKQRHLLGPLLERSRTNGVFHVPINVNTGKREASEYTQRTRSFLFAALGFILARLFDRKDLSFYENGIVSLNLPIAEHVLGARASRTTHPRVLAGFSKLFSLLCDFSFHVQNPYIWKTKTQVVQTLRDLGAADLIGSTVSCARIRQLTRSGKHCGVCSQCLERKLGILAADASRYEPPDFYAVDLFEGEHEPGPALTMIESYMLRAHKLASMSELTFSATYGQVFRVLPYLPGDLAVNARNLWDLHRRHGREVVSVVDTELKRTASLDQTLARSKKSLLSLIVSAPLDLRYADPVETEPPTTQQAAADHHDYTPERIQFAVSESDSKIIFKNGIQLGGGAFDLIAQLLKEFEEDLDSGTFLDQYRFVRAKSLAKRLDISEPSLRKAVMRTRRRIEKEFARQLGQMIDGHDIIENQGWHGYRLNPHLLLVKAIQLRVEKGRASHLKRRPVTSLHARH
jgi:hypothetical protein